MLLDLHTDFSGGRSGGLVFPSLSEFSTVCVIHKAKAFGIVNKADLGVLLELSCFFDDPTVIHFFLYEIDIVLLLKKLSDKLTFISFNRVNSVVHMLGKNCIPYFLFFWLCCVFIAVCRLSLVVENGGYSLVVVHRLLIMEASLITDHRL